MRVLEGTGGMTKLGDDDKDGIKQTIDEDILKGCTIAFESSAVRQGPRRPARRRRRAGAPRPPRAGLVRARRVDDGGHLTGTATVKQTDYGIKPYSALFGTLKVADEVVVAVDAQLPPG